MYPSHMSEFPPVVVINLERAPDRRKMMAEHLDAMGISHRFLAAVDGKQLTPEQQKQYSRTKTFVRLNRDLHPNEIGCAHSHINAWREAAAADREVLIMEDDIRLHDDFRRVVETREQWLPADWDVVNLAHDIAKPVDLKPCPVADLSYKSVCSFEGVVGRAACYLVHPESAKKLVECALPIAMPADDILGDASVNELNIYGIEPRIATWRDAEECPSNIWAGAKMDSFTEESRSSGVGLLMRVFTRIHRTFRK